MLCVSAPETQAGSARIAGGSGVATTPTSGPPQVATVRVAGHVAGSIQPVGAHPHRISLGFLRRALRWKSQRIKSRGQPIDFLQILKSIPQPMDFLLEITWKGLMQMQGARCLSSSSKMSAANSCSSSISAQSAAAVGLSVVAASAAAMSSSACKVLIAIAAGGTQYMEENCRRLPYIGECDCGVIQGPPV